MGVLANFKNKNEGDFCQMEKGIWNKGNRGLKSIACCGLRGVACGWSMASVWAKMGDEAAQ